MPSLTAANEDARAAGGLASMGSCFNKSSCFAGFAGFGADGRLFGKRGLPRLALRANIGGSSWRGLFLEGCSGELAEAEEIPASCFILECCIGSFGRAGEAKAEAAFCGAGGVGLVCDVGVCRLD